MPLPNEAAGLDLRQLLRVLGRRRWLLILPWLAALGVGVAAAFLLTPIYTSQVTMVLEQPQALTGPLGGMVTPGANTDQQANLMKEQVQSTPFLRGVIAAAGLRKDPAVRAWALKRAKNYPGLPPDQRVEAVVTDHLRESIDVRRNKGDVFEITVEDFDPDRARTLAASVANQFVLSSKASQLEAARATQAFSVEQGEIYRRKLAESENRLEAATRAALGAQSTPVDAGNLTRARGLLDQANLEVEEQRQKVSDLRGQVQSRGLGSSLGRLTTPRVSVLAAQLVQLDQQLSSALLNASATGTGPDPGEDVRVMIARRFGDLESELNRAASTALASLSDDSRDLLVRARIAQADLDAKQAGRDAIQRQLGRFQAAQSMAPDLDVNLKRLQAQVDNDRQLYNSFVQQAAAAQITEAYQSAKVGGRFSVLEPADRPTGPSRPNRPLILLLSFLLGGIVGVGTVVVVEQHDESVKDAQEVESLLGLPVLGAVPRVPDLMRRRSGETAAAEAARGARGGLLHRLKVESPLGLEFRRIYLKLAKTRGRSLPRTLLLTSATRGEGKSTTAASLAITMAREERQKVLLVDFDLRSPSLHRILGLPTSTWGVAQMLHNRVFDESYVRATAQPNLDFLAAGRSEWPASELIDTDSCEWFFREASARYALVVADAPPNLAVPDPLVAGRAVEGVIFVVKAGTTIRKAAEYGVKVQREARDNLVGILMNDAGEILPSYYGYRARSYGYRSPEEAGGA